MRNNFFERHDLIRRYEALIRNQEAISFDLEDFFQISGYYAWQGDYEGALLALKYAEFSFPNEEHVKLAIIDIMLNLVELDDSEEYLEQLSELYSNNRWVMIRIARFYLQDSKFDLAEQILEQVVLSDTDEDVYIPILNMLRGKDLDLQIKYLHKALDQRITEEDCLVLGECYVEKEQFKDAEIYFQKALDLDAFNLDTWECLGNMYLKQDLMPQALHAFEMCLTIDEEQLYPYIGKGTSLIKMGKNVELASFIAETIKFYQETACDDNVVDVHCAFANIYMDHGEWEIAVTELKKVLYFYESDEAESSLARCLVQLGDFEGAMVHIDKAINLDPSEGEYWKIKGMVYACTEAFNETLFCFFSATLLHCCDYDLLQMLRHVIHLSSFEDVWEACVERSTHDKDLFDNIQLKVEIIFANNDTMNVKSFFIVELAKLFSQINEPESVIKCMTILTELDIEAAQIFMSELGNTEHFNLICEAIPELMIND